MMWNNRTALAFPEDDGDKLSRAIKSAETTCSPEIQASLYIDFKHSPLVQLALAENEECHPRVLFALLSSQYDTVIEAVIDNPSAPDSLLVEMINSENLNHSDRAYMVLADRLLTEAMNTQ